MIPVLDAKNAPHIRIPLWSDPAIQQANWPDVVGGDEPTKIGKAIRSDFMDSGDPSALSVPDGATIATIRALSAAEMGTADRTAGRRPQLGSVMSMKRAAIVEGLKAPTAEMLEAMSPSERAVAKSNPAAAAAAWEKTVAKMPAPERDAVRLDVVAAAAAWVDKLEDNEAQSLEDWTDWLGRRAVAVVMMGVEGIYHPKFGDCSVEVFAGSITDPALRSNILAELAHRVKAYSGLGIRPKGLSNSACGSKKPSDAEAKGTGSVMAAMTDCDDNEALAEVASAPN